MFRDWYIVYWHVNFASLNYISIIINVATVSHINTDYMIREQVNLFTFMPINNLIEIMVPDLTFKIA